MKTLPTMVFIVSLFYLSLVSAASFVEDATWEQDLAQLHASSVAWGDVDSDGDADLALTGCTDLVCDESTIKSYIYLNNGTSFEESSAYESNLIGVYNASLVWTDVNNDAKLDLIAAGMTASGRTANVYVNDGTTLIEQEDWEEELVAVGSGSSLAVGDLDHDGRVDLVLGGNMGDDEDTYSGVLNVYMNTGSSFVEDSTWEDELLGLVHGSILLADVDGDGYLDLLRVGTDNAADGGAYDPYSLVYLNTGETFVEDEDWEWELASLADGTVTVGDIDNDGDMDLILVGDQGGANTLTRVYLNEGDTFIEDETWSENIYDSSVYHAGSSLALGDLDADGDLDLVAVGDFPDAYSSRVYLNDGETFVEDEEWSENLAGAYPASLALFDIEGDSDLDVVLTGCGGPYSCMGDNLATPLTKVYLSDSSLDVVNTQPSAPVTFFPVLFDELFSFAWNSGSDAETPTDALMYVLRIGTSSGGNDVFSSVFGATARPSSTPTGNVQFLTSVSFPESVFEENNTYYWSVQTVDNGYRKSAWSTEQSFVYDTDAPVVSLVIPANGSAWTSSDTVLFQYAVNDFAIENCTLALSTGTTITKTDITVDMTQDFTATLSNGVHQWSVSCVDLAGNEGASETFDVNVDYTAPEESSSSGGGSSGGGNVEGTRGTAKTSVTGETVDETSPETEEETTAETTEEPVAADAGDTAAEMDTGSSLTGRVVETLKGRSGTVALVVGALLVVSGGYWYFRKKNVPTAETPTQGSP